jgi:hypothetical protein
LLTGLLGKWILVPVGVIVGLILIRLGADIYWWLKGDEE